MYYLHKCSHCSLLVILVGGGRAIRVTDYLIFLNSEQFLLESQVSGSYVFYQRNLSFFFNVRFSNDILRIKICGAIGADLLRVRLPKKPGTGFAQPLERARFPDSSGPGEHHLSCLGSAHSSRSVWHQKLGPLDSFLPAGDQSCSVTPSRGLP